MKISKSEFRHESIQDKKSIQAILKALTEGINNNEITFSDEDDSVVMHPQGLLNLKISAVKNGNDNSINIRIKWMTEPDKKRKQSRLSVKSG